MKAEELRIGNILNVDGNYWTIDTISSEELYFKENIHCNHVLNAEPISLTEEILLKCGFEFEEFLDDEDENKWFCLRYGKHKFKTDSSVDYKSVYYGRGVVKVKTLHQLQNLYFALTEKELEIKL